MDDPKNAAPAAIPLSASRAGLSAFFTLTYLAALALHIGYLAQVSYVGPWTPLFAGASYLAYMLLYLMPVIAIASIAHWAIGRRRWGPLLVAIIAIAGTSLLQVLLYADRFIYKLYGFHLNGFVWNLVFTRGGLDSLGGGTSTTISFSLIIAALIAGQITLYLLSTMLPALTLAVTRAVPRRWVVAALFVAIVLFEQAAYGLSYLRGYTPVLLASNALPIYFPISFNRLAESLGVHPAQGAAVQVNVDSIDLQYPRKPLTRAPDAKSLNIVWLVTESLRADMLDPEIMPRTYAFAQEALWLRNHYSGGNGTRMAVFSMFYGLYGYYWFPFLTERRGPVFFDELIDRNYQMDFYTGAGFSYPEFDRTVFVRMDPKKLHENTNLRLWKRDEENVTDVISFIEKRDRSRPFLAYIFFESPHANYHFPQEAVIRPDYAKDLNYAEMDLKKEIGPIKNRYINACHYLDSQVARMLDYLSEPRSSESGARLLDSTIVLFTGDHGEEFMEKGRWGHNSAFTQEQIRTPGILWIPGQRARAIDDMTCHLDFPPTILHALGVTNPPEDYCLGLDLFSGAKHDYLVLADWNRLAYIDRNSKVVLPWKVFGFAQQEATTLDDQPLKDTAFFESNRNQVVEVMKSLRQFSK